MNGKFQNYVKKFDLAKAIQIDGNEYINTLPGGAPPEIGQRGDYLVKQRSLTDSSKYTLHIINQANFERDFINIQNVSGEYQFLELFEKISVVMLKGINEEESHKISSHATMICKKLAHALANAVNDRRAELHEEGKL